MAVEKYRNLKLPNLRGNLSMESPWSSPALRLNFSLNYFVRQFILQIVGNLDFSYHLFVEAGIADWFPIHA